MDLKSGIIKINGEIFAPGYTFEDFQRSTFFEGQDAVRIIRLNKTVQISGNNFITSLFFRNKILYMISMVCVDINPLFRKKLNASSSMMRFLLRTD